MKTIKTKSSFDSDIKLTEVIRINLKIQITRIN